VTIAEPPTTQSLERPTQITLMTARPDAADHAGVILIIKHEWPKLRLGHDFGNASQFFETAHDLRREAPQIGTQIGTRIGTRIGTWIGTWIGICRRPASPDREKRRKFCVDTTKDCKPFTSVG
jgi:hypothetical protein